MNCNNNIFNNNSSSNMIGRIDNIDNSCNSVDLINLNKENDGE